MYKSVSFNIYELNLQDIVYKDQKAQQSSRNAQREVSKSSADKERPIPKPIDEFWKKPPEYNKKW
jgi:hypothetical protein